MISSSTNLALLLFFHQISLGPNRRKIACLTSEQPTEMKWPWPRCLWTHWSNPATGCQGSSQTANGKACKCYQVKPCDMWDFQLQNVTKCKQNTRTYKNHQVMYKKKVLGLAPIFRFQRMNGVGTMPRQFPPRHQEVLKLLKLPDFQKKIIKSIKSCSTNSNPVNPVRQLGKHCWNLKLQTSSRAISTLFLHPVAFTAVTGLSGSMRIQWDGLLISDPCVLFCVWLNLPWVFV